MAFLVVNKDNDYDFVRGKTLEEIKVETAKKAICATIFYQSVQSFNDKISRIFMNKDKGVFGIKMDDGTEVKVHLQKGDTWDTEKALLLCYIKWVNQNKSDFNEIFNLLDRIEDTSKGEKAQG